MRLGETWRPLPLPARRMTALAMILLVAALLPRQASGAGHAAARLPRRLASAFAAPLPVVIKDVAIVGGGLAGLATAWHLASSSSSSSSSASGRRPRSITIWDPRPPGQAEASSVAGGLLHPLSPRNKLLWAGPEGFVATARLLAASKAALERAGDAAAAARLHSPPGSILRPALTPQHEQDYRAAAAKLPEWLEWLDGPAWLERAAGGGGHRGGGLVLRQSAVISVPDYLRGLWLALGQMEGVEVAWEQRALPSLSSLWEGGNGGLDAVVVASGAGIRTFPELRALPVELVRGRTLLVEDAGGEPLEAALLCGEYVVPGVDARQEVAAAAADGGGARRVLRCGATREYVKDPWDVPPAEDKEGSPELLEALRQKAEHLHAPLTGFPAAYAVTTGTRVGSKRSNLGKLPILGRVPVPAAGPEAPRVWLYTALGGRGMVHHAHLGGMLAEAVLADDEDNLPPEVRAPLAALAQEDASQ